MKFFPSCGGRGENEFGVTGKVKVNILLVAENQKKRRDKLGAWNNVRTDWGKRNGKRHVDINGFHSGEDKNHTQTSPFSVILMDIRWGWFHFYILMSSHPPGCASVAVSLSTYTRDSNRDDVIGGRHATVNKVRERGTDLEYCMEIHDTLGHFDSREQINSDLEFIQIHLDHPRIRNDLNS